MRNDKLFHRPLMGRQAIATWLTWGALVAAIAVAPALWRQAHAAAIPAARATALESASGPGFDPSHVVKIAHRGGGRMFGGHFAGHSGFHGGGFGRHAGGHGFHHGFHRFRDHHHDGFLFDCWDRPGAYDPAVPYGACW